MWQIWELGIFEHGSVHSEREESGSEIELQTVTLMAEICPPCTPYTGKVDLFLHDSEHTYETMMFEFTTVWDYLVQGKPLLSDDIHWNDSFGDFCKKVNRKGRELFFTGLGALIK